LCARYFFHYYWLASADAAEIIRQGALNGAKMKFNRRASVQRNSSQQHDAIYDVEAPLAPADDVTAPSPAQPGRRTAAPGPTHTSCTLATLVPDAGKRRQAGARLQQQQQHLCTASRPQR